MRIDEVLTPERAMSSMTHVARVLWKGGRMAMYHKGLSPRRCLYGTILIRFLVDRLMGQTSNKGT